MTLLTAFLLSGCNAVFSEAEEPEISKNAEIALDENNKQPDNDATEPSDEEESSLIEINEDIFRKPKEEKPPTKVESSSLDTSKASKNNEIIGLWLAYLDYVNLLQDKSEAEAKKSINNAFEQIKNDGFNTIFIQIRPFSDAIYPSDMYPWSHILNKDSIQGKNPGYDPLALMVSIAKEKDLKVHGWINPYRISLLNHPKAFADDNILNNTSMSEKDFISLGSSSFINPASEYGRQYVVDGIKEILENYSLDGIQFDDYFYPSQDEGIDKEYYSEYLSSGGTLALADYRRENVNLLVKQVYSEIKNINSSIIFGISPDANIERNYTQHYADVSKWIKEDGYLDYIMPQIYFGFNHVSLGYDDTVKAWNSLTSGTNKSLMIGIGVYKIGLEDEWAGEDGKFEWIENGSLIAEQYENAKTASQYGGVCLFRYDVIYNPDSWQKAQVEKELDAFKEAVNKYR